MSRIAAQVRISAPTSHVWPVLADFGGIHRWAPNVVSSHALTEQNAGVGAARHCEVDGFGPVQEYVESWDEGRRYFFRVEGIGPMKTVRNGFAVEEDGDSTIVTLTINYEVKYGLLGRMMDFFMVRRGFRKAAISLLTGLKHHVETGETVGAEIPSVTEAPRAVAA